MKKKIELWKALVMAIGAAVIASLPIMCNGCSVAVKGQLTSSATVAGKEAPGLPDRPTAKPDKAPTKPAKVGVPETQPGNG